MSVYACAGIPLDEHDRKTLHPAKYGNAQKYKCTICTYIFVYIIYNIYMYALIQESADYHFASRTSAVQDQARREPSLF